MKRLPFFLVIVTVLLLSACSGNNNQNKSNHNENNLEEEEEDVTLGTSVKGEHVLYTIDDKLDLGDLAEEDDVHITAINNRESQGDPEEEFPELEIDKSPAYVLAESDEIIHKTYDDEEMIDYIKENDIDDR